MRLAFFALSSFLGLFFVSSCYQKPDFPLTPAISNPLLTSRVITDCTLVKSDEVRIKVDYQDGDGDLGLGSNDINPPFNPPTNIQPNPFYTNYKLKVLRKVGDDFQPLPLPDPNLTYDQRFPRLDEPGRVSPLQGTLTNKVLFSQLTMAPNTILKFRIQILDRALNVSNEIETDTITVNRR